MDTLAAVDLGLIAFGAVVSIAWDHRACRGPIDRAADDMLVTVDAVLAEEKAAPSGKVADQPVHNRSEQLRRAITVTGRR